MSLRQASLSPTVQPGLTEETFELFRALIRERTGIHMRDGKQFLIANRLRRRLVQLGIASYEEYYALLARESSGPEMVHFIDAVSTNETSFFREENQFQALATVVLPELMRAHGRVRIWSAGCSTGEEAYTLRIVADRVARSLSLREPEIIGTDVSTSVILRAREGIYGERSLARLPADLRSAHFKRIDEGLFQVNEEARARVEFQVRNLFSDPPPWEQAHVIFCRNVMIYFDKPTQIRLVDGIFERALHSEGYLFVGHSESLSGFSARFRWVARLKAPIYRKREEAFR